MDCTNWYIGHILRTKKFEIVQYDKDDEDWIICTKDNGIYKASGGPDKLEEILLIFKNWVENEQ